MRVTSRIGRIAAVSGAFLVIATLTTGCGGEGSTESGQSVDQVGVAEQQEQLAAALRIDDPPAVEVVRVVTPEERGALVDACLAEQGFPVGEGSPGIPESQMEAFDLAQFVCMARYPVDPELSGTWTEVQTAIQYEWTINTLIPCLEARGFEIEDVPSRSVFIETWFTDSAFLPYAQLPLQSITNVEFAALEQECPQTPPSEVLYGGVPLDN